MRNLVRSILPVVFLSSTSLPAFAANMFIEYDALGGKENGGDSFASGGNILVDRILTTRGGIVGTVSVFVSPAKADLGSFRVVFARVSKGTQVPRNVLMLATIQDGSLTTGKFTKVTITPTTPLSLEANTPYYFGIARASGGKSSIVLGNTVSPAVLARPNVQAGAYYYNNGGVQPNSGGPYQIKVIVEKR